MSISNTLFPETDQQCIFPSPESVKPDLAAGHGWIKHDWRPITLCATKHTTYLKAGQRIIRRSDYGMLSAADIHQIIRGLDHGHMPDADIFTITQFAL